MAAAMASLNIAAAVPVASCVLSRSNDNSLHMSSSANFGGLRLDSATAASPSGLVRSSRPLVVRADEKPSFWENITSVFGSGKSKASDAAAQAEKELKKASRETKSSSGDFGGKAEGIKKDLQTQVEGAAEGVKAGVEDLQSKIEDAVESAKKN